MFPCRKVIKCPGAAGNHSPINSKGKAVFYALEAWKLVRAEGCWKAVKTEASASHTSVAGSHRSNFSGLFCCLFFFFPSMIFTLPVAKQSISLCQR